MSDMLSLWPTKGLMKRQTSTGLMNFRTSCSRSLKKQMVPPRQRYSGIPSYNLEIIPFKLETISCACHWTRSHLHLKWYWKPIITMNTQHVINMHGISNLFQKKCHPYNTQKKKERKKLSHFEEVCTFYLHHRIQLFINIFKAHKLWEFPRKHGCSSRGATPDTHGHTVQPSMRVQLQRCHTRHARTHRAAVNAAAVRGESFFFFFFVFRFAPIRANSGRNMP